MTKTAALGLLLAIAAAQTGDEPFPASHTLSSPGGDACVSMRLLDGLPRWKAEHLRKPLLSEAPLGIVPEPPFEGGFAEKSFKVQSLDETWKPTWGRFSSIRNHCNQSVWSLKERGPLARTLEIVVRAYDRGVAVRYILQGNGKAVFRDDATHFSFAESPTCWGYNGERANLGPSPIEAFKGTRLPLTFRLKDGRHAGLLEAAIYRFAPLEGRKTGPRSYRTFFPKSSVDLPAETSWRVLLLGSCAGDLLTGNLLENLNPPCRIEKADWIRPGLAMWDWRAWGGKGSGGFVYNLDMASWRRMIDFASRHESIRYLVLDANWYGHEFDKKSNPMKSRDYLVYQPDPKSPKMGTKPAPKDWKDPIDVPALIRYGKERGVGVILYINEVARKNWDFEKTLKTYREWGAAGIKYGFMKGGGQQKVLTTREIVELCAANKLLCNFHDGPVAPSGDLRTWPNYVAREFCHSQCDATRSFTPQTFCTTVFCNMLAGPLDMCNGFFTLTDLDKARPKVFRPVESTVVAECARILITFSGLSLIPDTPESYESKPDLLEFISNLPMRWDETRILNGSIGEHITTARRNGTSWFIASACNEKGAVLPVTLDFLEEGKTYVVTFYEDAPDTHYQNNKEAYVVRKGKVRKGEAFKIRLAPGGGHCMWIREAEK